MSFGSEPAPEEHATAELVSSDGDADAELPHQDQSQARAAVSERLDWP